jgi:hypothetical protein
MLRLQKFASLIRSLRLGALALFTAVAGSCLFTMSASGQPDPPGRDLFECLTACNAGKEAMENYCYATCRRHPPPAVRMMRKSR